MKGLLSGLLAATMLAPMASAEGDPLTKPITALNVEQLLTPQPPVKIHGNTYYVGYGRLAVVLIKTDAGLVLIDGALPQSVATIEAKLGELGFRIQDVKYILNSEVHFDHSGGIAALARDSGATVLTSEAGVKALRAGHSDADDPQYGGLVDVPAPKKLRAVKDGEVIKVGNVSITAHYTPGHTPGSTTWSWQSCENGTCLDVVFGASLNPVSNKTYRFSDGHEATFRNSIDTVRKLRCDILIPSHPDVVGGDERLKRVAADPTVFVDANSCRAFADKFEKLFDARLVKERS